MDDIVERLRAEAKELDHVRGDLLNEAADEIAAPSDRGEFAWCIERGDSPAHSPTYWAGPDQWSQDHLDAIRFARKEDAEHVACRLGQGYHRVCDHGWVKTAGTKP